MVAPGTSIVVKVKSAVLVGAKAASRNAMRLPGGGVKLEANKTAEIDIRAAESVIWSAEVPTQLFGCFFIFLVG